MPISNDTVQLQNVHVLSHFDLASILRTEQHQHVRGSSSKLLDLLCFVYAIFDKWLDWRLMIARSEYY